MNNTAIKKVEKKQSIRQASKEKSAKTGLSNRRDVSQDVFDVGNRCNRNLGCCNNDYQHEQQDYKDSNGNCKD